MASIFTFEPEPVRLASPWPTRDNDKVTSKQEKRLKTMCGISMPLVESIDDYDLSKLNAEPQEGPVEYKLHLLLRPRRGYVATTTVQKISGSHISKSYSATALGSRATSAPATSPAMAPSHQIRQNRLQHLTTQLLWRMQQSSPHHSSSKSHLVMPVLPDTSVALSSLKEPGPLVSGLEESQGALYEIGVSDDGILVGLTIDELEESLQVLRAMAFSLGCVPHVLKTVLVGDCEWQDESVVSSSSRQTRQRGSLWVAEVLIAPRSASANPSALSERPLIGGETATSAIPNRKTGIGATHTAQLRVSLTGSTTSGKSSLLGTLSTSTLDNGRGKSRLSLLRHRHEIVSGVTSSLAQELIGYHELDQRLSTGPLALQIVNYASGNVSSWTDVHNAATPGRLVFLTDSAGHPKFRRTTVRGLISWAPHWMLCCIAADDGDEQSGQRGATAPSGHQSGSVGHEANFSKTHLELCLKLELPLVCVITKLDVASKPGLRKVVGQVLSTIKAAGRKPVILPTSPPTAGYAENSGIAPSDFEAVREVVQSMSQTKHGSIIPIVLTSVVTGTGIGQVHSLLQQLPLGNSALPMIPEALDDKKHSIPSLATVFHIDETFAARDNDRHRVARPGNECLRLILSGYLRHGSLRVGESLLIGPFSNDLEASITSPSQAQASRSSQGLSKSLPKELTACTHHQLGSDPTVSASTASDFVSARKQRQRAHFSVWHTVKVASLRYLRLPVSQLSEGQVGTVAISPFETLYTTADPCLRRGMILCKLSSLAAGAPPPSPLPPAYRTITALFATPNIYVNPGSSVTVYTASIRALAKIVTVKIPERRIDPLTPEPDQADIPDEPLPSDTSSAASSASSPSDAPGVVAKLEEIEISFRFTNSVEWVELGTKLLVMPASGISMLSPPPTEAAADDGAGAAIAGFDGFVGRIVSAAV